MSMKNDPRFKDFELPKKVLDKLYELSGASEAYKGFIIAYSTENGDPIVYTKCDTQVTEYALAKALETYLTEAEGEPYEINEDLEENG